MGKINLIRTLGRRNEGVFKIILVWAMCKCMVSMATHSRFENGGIPTKTHISAITYYRLLNLITNLSLDIYLLSPWCICKLSYLHIH